MKIHCSTCNAMHDLSDMQVGHERPDAWYAVPPDERDARWVMDTELAVLDDENRFLRGVIEIPVDGEPHPYAWGVWVAVGEADYRRYVGGERSLLPWRRTALRGRLATQLRGYPQTLGLPVTIHPQKGGRRPAFTVDDALHPLAVEQRDGVQVERVLEMLGPWLHRTDAPEPLGSPREATLEADGWRLLDVVESWRQRGAGPIWFPDAETRSSVPIGAAVKVLWEIVASNAEGRAATHVERMWVDIDHREGGGDGVRYSGTLDNDPQNPGLVRWGDRVWFTPRHVLDVSHDGDDNKASDAAETRCERHGPSFPAYVCLHLAKGEGQGFHAAGKADEPRPDAWCDRCDDVRARSGGWNEDSEAFARITVVCGTCYDCIEEINRRA